MWTHKYLLATKWLYCQWRDFPNPWTTLGKVSEKTHYEIPSIYSVVVFLENSVCLKVMQKNPTLPGRMEDISSLCIIAPCTVEGPFYTSGLCHSDHWKYPQHFPICPLGSLLPSLKTTGPPRENPVHGNLQITHLILPVSSGSKRYDSLSLAKKIKFREVKQFVQVHTVIGKSRKV